MIYSTILLNATNHRKIASSEYWAKPIPRKYIDRYLVQLEALIEKSVRLKYKPVALDEYKFVSRDCGKGIIIFVTDLEESDEDLMSKINRAAKSLRLVLSKNPTSYVKKNYGSIIERFVQSQFVIALIGRMGVGKTSLLQLLLGRPAPSDYVPTIAVNMEALEGIKFANYEIVIFDFAGEEAARDLWDLSTSDIASKTILSELGEEFPETPIIVFANKQDTANSLDPTAISKVMGSTSHAMVAIDLAYRDDLLEILVGSLSEHFVLDVPEMPIEELLYVNGES
ncbi:MAG: ADP-ribosylation factor-like protein [Candidatus Thorarchaeota archaeon]|jgi:signal recognition particle receptor subunit beta